MTDLMYTLFNYISEKRVRDFLPGQYGNCFGALVEDQETALLNTLTDAQKALWDQYCATQMEYNALYEQALFQAAFALAMELR